MDVISQRVSLWREAFTDQTTGITAVLRQLIWNYEVFSLSAQIIRMTASNPTRHERINQPFFDLFAHGYWLDFLVGVRKLVDGYANEKKKNIIPLDATRGVYSLSSVLNDLEKHQPSITRKFYVETIHDAVFDLERLEAEEYELLVANGGLPQWGNPMLSKSKWVHESFDRLSGVDANERNENDLIDLEYLQNLRTRIKEVGHICQYVSSHVVHAGNIQSRENKYLKEFDISNAAAALSTLTDVANTLAIHFGNDGGYDLPVYPGDILAGLDMPLIDNGDKSELYDFWHQLSSDISQWTRKKDV